MVKSLSLLAPISQLGYGITGLNILKALSKHTPVALWPIGQPQVTNQADHTLVGEAIDRAKFFDKKAPCIRLWHQFDMAQFVGTGLHVGFPIFELDQFNKLERHHLRSVDELFVCSNWAKEIVKANTIEIPTHVVPLGVDTETFKPVKKPIGGPTIFFNCGKWETRKGHDILIKAFTKAFTPEDNVELWMMCENPFCTPKEKLDWENKYTLTEHFKQGRIRLIPRVETQDEVYHIMAQTDCGVFPSRAEGWNLEALEMLACGKQLIITDYSAHKDFTNVDNSFLIPVTDTELAFDNKWFHGQGSWAKLDGETIEAFAYEMRSMHDSKQGGSNLFNDAGPITAKQFTWDATARRILECLNG